MLEERAREAEKDVAHLSERLREANRNLEEEKRKRFFAEIRQVIERLGGEISIYDTLDLQLARKP